MNFVKSYTMGAIIIGLLEMIDGTLLILNKGLLTDFNLIVAVTEISWFFMSIIFVLVFRRFKLSILSPLSFCAYIISGWTIVSFGDSSQSSDVVPFGFAIAGALFGLYYVIINERLRGKW